MFRSRPPLRLVGNVAFKLLDAFAIKRSGCGFCQSYTSAGLLALRSSSRLFRSFKRFKNSSLYAFRCLRRNSTCCTGLLNWMLSAPSSRNTKSLVLDRATFDFVRRRSPTGLPLCFILPILSERRWDSACSSTNPSSSAHGSTFGDDVAGRSPSPHPPLVGFITYVQSLVVNARGTVFCSGWPDCRKDETHTLHASEH